ncbi:YbaB/EbfC family nucleoid-associated protein [Rhodococcus sp. HNM0569]|uniref:YbaB/EbfC family nucleoid-associated protein n=1 Tax=Rhodococcus sp. HNM0569 TaxID=2716340 RepID=UPI00146B8BF8|nr:YbaB/EbfC family nucleoid-associated protein [Rhodococcus sp. HNM0569]NLU81838.1 YbaB/EbfC family nucleoid-associated protein [Rhodococcus sp. HNM0569]
MSTPDGRTVDDIVNRAHDQIALLEDTLAGLDGIRVRVDSEGGEVTAEVDGNGALTGLWMDDAITRLDARAVEALVVSTAAEAARQATERRTKIMAALENGFERRA